MVRRTKKPTQGKENNKSPLITLAGLTQEDAVPSMKITAWGSDGKCLHEASVTKDQSFKIPDEVIKKAHKVLIGPSDAEPEQLKKVALTFHAAHFKKQLRKGTFEIAQPIWSIWFPQLRCVSGQVRVCRRPFWWLRELVYFSTMPLKNWQNRQLNTNISLSDAIGSSILNQSVSLKQQNWTPTVTSLYELLNQPIGCAPVCHGTVEVYRRVCCCKPWVIADPRLPGLLDKIKDAVRHYEIPKVLSDPPDPGPLAFAEKTFIKDGSLNDLAIHAAEDLIALETLSASDIPQYIKSRPHLFCWSHSCSEPVKVAEGDLGPGGRFNICWWQFSSYLKKGCHEEFSYIVKQSQGPFTYTIYNGLAANRWHAADDDPTLTSYHHAAYGCRDNQRDPVIFLDLIGGTGAHELITPEAVSATSVATPGENDGLVFPEIDGLSRVTNRNWGGNLRLSIMFGEEVQDVGVKYYRLSISKSGANGDPVGERHYLNEGLKWNKTVLGGDIVPVSLGPDSRGVGANRQDNLYQIPFDTNPDTNWNAGQYHAILETSDPRWAGPIGIHDPDIRHLLTLEVFDQNGKRLRPNGTLLTGLGGLEAEAGFTYQRRFAETGPTAEVPFGALTHMFWWDNRDVFADIVDYRKNGEIFDNECLFLKGEADSTFGVGYRAYHPNEKFQHHHRITWRRGLGNKPGATGTLQPSILNNVGMPPSLPGASATNQFQEMLRTDLDTGRKKCAFTAFLNIWNKRTDGYYLGFTHEGDTAAFVIDITPGNSGNGGPPSP